MIRKFLLVDDDSDDTDLFQEAIRNIDHSIELHTAPNCKDVLRELRERKLNPEIIFLDINMPNLSGFQLMKIIQPKQPVIFTTAYSEYAVESYELNAVDYLLKPFSFERFTKAVYKAIDLIRSCRKPGLLNDLERSHVFYIKSDGKNYPVKLDDILYCEAMKNYTLVILKNQQKLMPLITGAVTNDDR